MSTETARLQALGRTARREIVKAITQAEGGHLGGPLSAVDTLCALYFHALNIDPTRPDDRHRDRFILSKGHSSIALYTVLALRGYFPLSELATFDAIDSRLQGHPDMTKLPGIDMSTGSLGLGFSAAVGIALGAKLAGHAYKTYVMVGDGECNEGIIWEGAHLAEKYQLDNLITIVDQNRLQQHGWQDTSGRHLAPYPGSQLADRWTAFGWTVIDVDGHDFDRLLPTLDAARRHRGSPLVIICHTIKGKGVSFMEGQPSWHSKIPTEHERRQAITELTA